jgi:hypothetical protein
MFDPKSRYASLIPYAATDSRGRVVTVIPAAPLRDVPLMGYHVRREGERLDHLATKYLSDPAGFWRIAEQNGVMTAEVLSEADEIAIPVR